MTGMIFEPVDCEPVVAWWQERFAAPPEQLDGYVAYQRGRDTIWLAPREVDPGDLSPIDGVGFPFVRIGGAVWKPTSVAAMKLGTLVTRNAVEVDRASARAFVSGASLDVGVAGVDAKGASRGYVIVRYLGVPLGCGHLLGEEVLCMIPKGRRAELDFG